MFIYLSCFLFCIGFGNSNTQTFLLTLRTIYTHTLLLLLCAVESNKEPRIKLSQELEKVTLPGRKCVYRFYGLGPNNNRIPLVDYMCLADEDPPKACRNDDDDGILCRNPFQQQDRIRIFPARVEALHTLVFDGGNSSAGMNTTADCTNSSSSIGDGDGSGGNNSGSSSLSETRAYVLKQLREEFPDSITRYESPTRYDVVVSPKLYTYFHELWEKNAPISERR